MPEAVLRAREAECRPSVGRLAQGVGDRAAGSRRSGTGIPAWALAGPIGSAVPARHGSITVSEPNDALEMEADRAADDVVRDTNAADQQWYPGERSRDGGAEAAPVRTLRRAAATSHTVGSSRQVSPTAAGVNRALASPGRPLDAGLRTFMERRLGHDLAPVRVHTDEASARSASALQARAYTLGTDIVFGRGQYSPTTIAGRRLIAHELVHTVQQQGSTLLLQRDYDQAALDQCIAELGGSPAYRPGGIASPEELERYRQECIERQRSSADRQRSRAIENLRKAWEYADISAAVRTELANLFSPASLAIMAAFALAYIGSQFTPIGWIADAVALVVLTATVILVGALVIDIARDLYRYFSAINATTEEELRRCGEALARALARGGVGILIALLTRGAGRAVGGPRPPTGTSAALVEVVAAGPVPVRVQVSAATAAEAVEASRLQQLASYAVMVPPPGGTGPAAPRNTSGGGGSGSRSPEGGQGAAGEGPSTGGARAAGGLSLTRVGYGESALSQLAQRLRLILGLRQGGNVAVFEFETLPPRFRAIVERLGGRNVILDGNRMAVQNVGGAAHSEQLAHQLIVAGRRAGLELNVRHIYTEYNPCTNTCLPLIRNNYPSAEVTFSFIWELWGRQTPQRNAAVDALFGSSGSGTGGTP